jgi:hypothetical protein
MAKRRFWKRDRKGQFARTGSGGRTAAQDKISGHARLAAGNLAVGRKGTAALHGAKIGTISARRTLNKKRRTAKTMRGAKAAVQADSIVVKADRAINILLLGAYVDKLGGSKVGKIATKGADKRLNQLQNAQRRAIRG